MYKCYQEGIVEGTESFSLSRIIGENLIYLAMWVLAGYLLWPVWKVTGLPLLTIIWALLVILIQILLKKHNCSGCYYYDKLCHLGWGKISSAVFEQDSGDYNTGIRLSLFYIVTPPLIFLTSLIFAIIKSPAVTYSIFLALYVILNITALLIRKIGCSVCAMRKVCPGSASKNDDST